MCCSCIDGMGGTNFEKLITLGTPEEIEAYFSQIPPQTRPSRNRGVPRFMPAS